MLSPQSKQSKKKTQKSTPHTSSPLGSCMEFRKCSHMCVCVQSRRLAKPRTTQADRWALAGQRNAQPSRIRSDQMIRFILSYRIYPSPKGSAMPPRQTKTKSVDSSSSSRPERETSWRTIPQVHLDDLRLRTACPACPSSGSQGLSRGGGPLAEGGSAARRRSEPTRTIRVPTCPPPSRSSTRRRTHRLVVLCRGRLRPRPNLHPRRGAAAASPMGRPNA